MAKQKVEIEVDVPDGYELTGEYRRPNEGDVYLSGSGGINICAGDGDFNRLIMRRVKQYREPVLPADYGKQCEFSDAGKTWVMDNLGWWHPTSGWRSLDRSLDDHGEYWNHCRIEKEST